VNWAVANWRKVAIALLAFDLAATAAALVLHAMAGVDPGAAAE